MELFSWIVIGLLVGFLAKMTFPAEREENIILLVGVAVFAAIVCGVLMERIFQTGLLSLSGASHVAAFIGAVAALFIMRIATTPRVPAPRRR